MTKQLYSATAWAVCGVLAIRAAAAAPDNPATGPTTIAIKQPAVPQKITVVEVTGLVQMRTDVKEKWQFVQKGMVLSEGADFRTGPLSSALLRIPPDQSIKIDRVTFFTVQQAVRSGNKVTTELLMKYGRADYAIEGGGLEYDSSIRSPGSALAVRGTVVSLYDQPPYDREAISYTGRAQFIENRKPIFFGGKSRASVSSNKTAAEVALGQSIVDPQYAPARTQADSQLIASEVSRGAVVSFDTIANIDVVRGGHPITDDNRLVATLPGQLNFVARWNGDADINTQFFLQKGDAEAILNQIFYHGGEFKASEVLFPGFGFNHSASGGDIPFDHRGGPAGGTEITFWKDPPPGIYGFGIVHTSGQPVSGNLEVFLNGSKQYLYNIVGDNFCKTKDLQTDLHQGFDAGVFFYPAIPALEAQVPVCDAPTSAKSRGSSLATKSESTQQMRAQVVTHQPVKSR
jgi:hypothetical protein